MTQIPEPQIESTLIIDMARGHEMSQALSTAIDCDIFTLCQLPKTANEVSQSLGTNYDMTKRFLNVLVALQLLIKQEDKYVNTALANTFLVKGEDFYQGNLIKLWASGYALWPKLGEVLKEGIKKVWTPETSEEMANVFDPTFTLAMAEYAMCGGVQAVAKTVSGFPEFRRAKRLLDLGGGTGIYSITLAQLKPDLGVTVFDIPPVLEITKEFISRYKMEGRVGLMGGDYMKDDFGAGYDIILASHSLYNPKKVLSPTLKKIYDALNDDGSVILNHWTVNSDGAGHQIIVLWDLWLWLMSYEHSLYTKDEYSDLLKEAGFSVPHIVDISIPSYLSTIVLGKKEAGWK